MLGFTHVTPALDSEPQSCGASEARTHTNSPRLSRPRVRPWDLPRAMHATWALQAANHLSQDLLAAVAVLAKPADTRPVGYLHVHLRTLSLETHTNTMHPLCNSRTWRWGLQSKAQPYTQTKPSFDVGWLACSLPFDCGLSAAPSPLSTYSATITGPSLH